MILQRAFRIFTILLGTLFGVALSQDYHYDDPLIDPYTIDNSFHLGCGNVTHRIMKILFRGDAYKVFSARNSSCIAEETETGHFLIQDALTIPECTPVENDVLDLHTLELVVQKGLVHRYDDPRHLVTCNYDVGGQQTSESKDTSDRDINRMVVFQQAKNTPNSNATMTMTVKNSKGHVVKTAYVGSYIQIEMLMETEFGTEESFRPWNCKAMAIDKENNEHVHWFLQRGCGDGNVIRRDRGFFVSKYEFNATHTKSSRAKSVFFRAFSLSNVATIQFECTYIVKSDATALGASCYKSPRFATRRKRRYIESSEFEEEPYVPTAHSPVILLLRRPVDDISQIDPLSVAMNSLAERAMPRMVAKSGFGLRNGLTSSGLNFEEVLQRARLVPASEMIGHPMVIGLIAGLCLTTFLLIAVSCLAVYLCCVLPSGDSYQKRLQGQEML